MTETKSVQESLQAELVRAEQELIAWATGKRSWMNEQMNAEASTEDRGLTLVRIAQRDAAEIEIATKKVIALRLVCGLTETGMDPVHAIQLHKKYEGRGF